MNFFGNKKTRTKLISSFVCIAIIVALLGLIFVNRIHEMRQMIQTLYDDRLVPAIDLGKISGHLNGIRSGVFLIAEEANVYKKQEIFRKASDHEKEINRLIEKYGATYLVPEEKRIFDEFKPAWKAYNESRLNIYNQALKADFEKVKINAATDSTQQFEVVDEKLRSLIDIQHEVGKALYEKADSDYRFARNIALSATIFAMLIALGFGIVLSKIISEPLQNCVNLTKAISEGNLRVKIADGEMERSDEAGQLLTAMKNMSDKLTDIVSHLKSTADTVASASQELSASSEQMSRGLIEQASKASQIASSSSEMAQAVTDIAGNASNIASSAAETTRIAEEGKETVYKSIEEVKAIATTVKDSAQLMVSLGAYSNQIGEIVRVINEIAEQTNLLALNAAIESARAGEQGRGFAVVADEVRKLAEKTAKATSEIGGMITVIQNEIHNAVLSMEEGTRRVNSGVECSSQAGTVLNNIVDSVNELHSMVQKIVTATEEMSIVSDHISRDIETIAGVSKETSLSSEQTAQASSDLARLSVVLQGVAGQFKL